MGMAASQARFLGLTARKSNVEYQGQQINQQRTALSNESANLYNQMLELTVPTPPSTNDYYKTVYTLDGSKENYAKSDYTISGTPIKTFNKQNEYKVNLSYFEEEIKGKSTNYYAGARTKVKEGAEYTNTQNNEDNGYSIYKLNFSSTAASGNSYTTSVIYDEHGLSPYSNKNDKTSLKIESNHLYSIDKDNKDAFSGYNEWYASLSKEEKADIDANGCYFYQDSNKKNYFISPSQFAILNKDEQEKDQTVVIGSSYGIEHEYTTPVVAVLDTSSSGRYSYIHIADDESYPATLRNQSFSISTTQEMDKEAYDDAYNDYEYEKTKYEKSISDINAQTEIIQNEDQQLELRLQQLNTEQDAISTEMDSVSKVIEDNVEKTFKVFA